jgi:quinolinate synthase
MGLRDEILALKKEKKARILAHYYVDGDIQDIADDVGDSLYLAQQGQLAKEKIILLAGVVFMAESVKILSPEKIVLAPDLEAGCSLVEQSPALEYAKWRNSYANSVAVTYVNSSAEVKAVSDVIVTSSNAKKIVAAIPKDKKILFGPDQNLGRYLSRESGREFVLWPGACQVHILFSATALLEMIKQHPDAVVISHPECDDLVLQASQVVGSTSRLLEEVKNNPAKKFIVGTETGIFHQMKKLRPDAVILQAPTEDKTCRCNDCPFMKMNSLEKIKRALTTLSPQIEIPEALRKKALVPLERMMALSRGEAVSWD